MAAGKSAAVEAYERAEDDMRKHQARVAEARKAAARELGDAVLASGAGKLPTSQLKAILSAAMAMGADQALAALGALSPSRGAAKGSGGNGSVGAEAKTDGDPAGAAA